MIIIHDNKITRKYMGWKGGEVDVHPGSFFSFFIFLQWQIAESFLFSVLCLSLIFFFLFSYNSFHSVDLLQSQNN